MATPVIVVGHKHPDNDSIAAAVGYAYLKNQLMKRTLKTNPEAKEYTYIPARLGPLPEESESILSQYEIEPPEAIAHVHVRVQDIMSKILFPFRKTLRLLMRVAYFVNTTYVRLW